MQECACIFVHVSPMFFYICVTVLLLCWFNKPSLRSYKLLVPIEPLQIAIVVIIVVVVVVSPL